MTINLGATGFSYGHKMVVFTEEISIAVITLWAVGGFIAGVIVGAILATVFSYSTGRIAIVKIKK
jgi:hypothetical protein